MKRWAKGDKMGGMFEKVLGEEQINVCLSWWCDLFVLIDCMWKAVLLAVRFVENYLCIMWIAHTEDSSLRPTKKAHSNLSLKFQLRIMYFACYRLFFEWFSLLVASNKYHKTHLKQIFSFCCSYLLQMESISHHTQPQQICVRTLKSA